MLDPSTVSWFVMIAFVSPGNSVWWTKVHLRADFFAWLVALGNILTMDILRKRHVIVFDRCCMCKKNEKFVDHLLLYCKVVCLTGCFLKSIWAVLDYA